MCDNSIIAVKVAYNGRFSMFQFETIQIFSLNKMIASVYIQLFGASKVLRRDRWSSFDGYHGKVAINKLIFEGVNLSCR